MPSFIDLAGKRIGAWLVLSRADNSGTSTMWNCRCSCGTERIVRAAHLATGASSSCGCKQRPTKHGGAKGEFTKKYKTWRQIKSRCCNPNHKNASIYEGKLCEAWMDYAQFDKDVPDPPSETMTIDRINNDLGYEPGNVRWVTMAEQHRNQSNCRWIEHNGKRQLLTDWANDLGVSVSTLHGRIKKWGIEKALNR